MPNFKVGIKALLLAVLMLSFAAIGHAQNYPARSVRLLVAFPAGSEIDTMARIAAAGLTDTLGQQFAIDNRIGSAGNTGAELAAKAPPDGYTLFMVDVGYAINATLFKRLNYDLLRDFAPVARIATNPYVIVVHPSLPARALADVVRLAKAQPGAMQYATAGNGTPVHLSAEVFFRQAGIGMKQAIFRNDGDALESVTSGQVPLFVSPLAPALPLIAQRQLRALAVTSAQRQPLLPDVPTVAESGYRGYEFGNWYGLVAPAATPAAIVNTLHDAALAGLKKPLIAKSLSDQGYVTAGDTPGEFGAYLKSQIDAMAKVIAALNLKTD